MYGLTEEDRRIRDTARAFVETLIPHEVEAELADGILPKETHGRASRPRNRIGPVRHQHAGFRRRAGMHGAAAGAGAGTVRAGDQRDRLGDGALRRSGGSTSPPTISASGGCCQSVRGEKHEAYAITEEFAGSDVSALQTTVRRDGDEYVVNGIKWHVTSFNLADYVFVEGVLDGGDHVLLVVDLPWPGVEVVRTPQYSHNIADEHPIVAFNDVRVPAANLVGTEGGPMTFTQDWFRFERMMVAARCVGAAQRLVDEATAFAQTRIVDGKPLGEHQLVAGMLADSATELFAARTMLLRGGPLDRRGPRPQDSARAGVDGEAVLLGDGGAGGRSRRADLRRPRLHAGERRGADVPRASRGAHLGGRQRDPADHCGASVDDARSVRVARPCLKPSSRMP